MNAKTFSIETQKAVLRKMVSARNQILIQYPFYGYLVMHLQLGVADCGTACTDMTHLLFDPDFAEKLSEKEIIFVMLHEVLHCCLEHCTRGLDYQPEIFNIAADIVVNSNILYSMRIPEFEVAGIPVMHTTPDGQEGYHFSAEEVYQMLIKNMVHGGPGQSGRSAPSGQSDRSDQSRQSGTSGQSDPSGRLGRTSGSDPSDPMENSIDSHDLWSSLEKNDAEVDKWKKLTAEAGKKYSSAEIPQSVRDYILELEREAKVDWRTVLQDFIQLYHDRFDYSFSPPDKRYSCSDFAMPAFYEQESEQLDKLWFCVDTSGSISQDTLSDVMSEILQAMRLFDRLSGKISFFDTQVTEPIPFEDEEDLLAIPSAVGGGGTSFSAIFQYLKEFPEDEIPSVIIVLTDGYCPYPPEKDAKDIPVLWIICDNPKDPPWGRYVHMDTE